MAIFRLLFLFYALTVKEDRFGFISLEANVVKSNHSNILKGLTKLSETNLVEHKLSRRPVRLIPPKLFFL